MATSLWRACAVAPGAFTVSYGIFRKHDGDRYPLWDAAAVLSAIIEVIADLIHHAGAGYFQFKGDSQTGGAFGK